MEILYKRGYVEYHSSLNAINVLKEYNIFILLIKITKQFMSYLQDFCISHKDHLFPYSLIMGMIATLTHALFAYYII